MVQSNLGRVSMLSFSGYRFAVERQPLARPFHFKGSFFTEKWINVVKLLTDAESAGAGDKAQGSTRGFTAIGGNAVLWSDPVLFGQWSEAGGNAVMSLLAERAAQLACSLLDGGRPGTATAATAGTRSAGSPIEAFEQIRPILHQDAERIAGHEVSPTFTLNSMVAVDFAIWKAFAAGRGTTSLRDLIMAAAPDRTANAFSEKPVPLARIPLISYNVPVDEVVALVSSGHRVLKVKIGQSGSTEKMLEKDKARLTELCTALSGSESIRFYLDANGRYPDLRSVELLLEHAGTLGILDRTIILEEPFAYERKIDVSHLPVRVAADESLHDVADLEERASLGYRALALKPAGKTLSLSVLMAIRAAELGIPCFVADSACVPLLVDWNRAFASLLPAFPGLEVGLLESNGAQNYANWRELLAELSQDNSISREPQDGLFLAAPDLAESSGGIFGHAGHYERLVEQ